ncbi:MAG: restriction endonuclease subunit S [Thermoanaerobaculia bacterium]
MTRWDPPSFHNIAWGWPKSIMRPIGTLLEQRREKVDRSKVSFSELQPITIHFDGSIDRRVLEEGREYTMDLWYARPGDFVVAKIDLKNGAVAIIPEGWKNVVVTGHFAVYRPRPEILAQYIHRVVQAQFFKDHLWRNKVGGEGRKEVKLDFFENLEIPLLPLAAQKAIIRHWNNERIQADKAMRRAADARRGMDVRLYERLGLTLTESASAIKIFAAAFSEIDRWSVSSNQARRVALDLDTGRYPPVDLGSLLTLAQYGTSEKANEERNGTPLIRMNNIVDGLLDLTKLKFVDLPLPERAKLLLSDGDILFNRTNSKQLVGKCAVFHGSADYVFASYLIRIRVNPNLGVPDFVSYLINSAVGRQQIDALSRQITGQANINSEELRSLRIPLPPPRVQRELVREIDGGRAEVQKQRQLASEILRLAELESEELILGRKKMEEDD